MRFPTLLTAAISALVAMTTAAPTSPEDTTINLVPANAKLGTNGDIPITPVFWYGQLTLDGPIYNVTGVSFEQIFTWVNARIDPAVQAKELADYTPVRVAHDELFCHDEIPWFRDRAVKPAIDFLWKNTGMCGMPPTDRTICGRVSCSLDSGVFLCTDRDPGAVPCRDMAGILAQVREVCNRINNHWFRGFWRYRNPATFWVDIRGVFMDGQEQERHC